MARGRVYSVATTTPFAVTTAVDLVTIKAGATIPFEVHAFGVGQKTLTAWEAKDIALRYIPATVTITAGTAVTPAAMLPSDAAAGVSATVNNTTLATSTGTIRDLVTDDWAFLNGYYWSAAGDDDRYVVKPSEAVVLRLGTAPSASMTVSVWMTIAEIM